MLLQVVRTGVKFPTTTRHLITMTWFSKYLLVSVALHAEDGSSAQPLTCLGHLKISCHGWEFAEVSWAGEDFPDSHLLEQLMHLIPLVQLELGKENLHFPVAQGQMIVKWLGAAGKDTLSSFLQEYFLCLTVYSSCDPFVVFYQRKYFWLMKHHCIDPSELVLSSLPQILFSKKCQTPCPFSYV